MEKGLIHFTYGNGNGKTTAAMGLALRALGNGWRIGIVQFLKGRPSGEVAILEKMSNVTVLRTAEITKFTFEMDEAEKKAVRETNDGLLSRIREKAVNGDFDLLVLDEATDACSIGLLDEDALLDFIKHKPADLEIALTGHQPYEPFLAVADYVTETSMKKHPYEQGIEARKGVEY